MDKKKKASEEQEKEASDRFEQALERFNRKVQQDGVLSEARRRTTYESPQDRRRRKAAAQRRKQRRTTVAVQQEAQRRHLDPLPERLRVSLPSPFPPSSRAAQVAYQNSYQSTQENKPPLLSQDQSELSTTQGSFINIRIIQEPLTAQNFATVISVLTELHTKCWLIRQGRLADMIEYVQTRDVRFTEDANLVITKLTHNSPAEIKLDVGVKDIAEALKTGIDSVVQAPLRHEEAKLNNQAKELATKLKELEAQSTLTDKEQARQIEAQQAELEKREKRIELEAKKLELEIIRLEIQEKRLEVEKKRIDYALEAASKMIDLLSPNADIATKGLLARTLLPNLLQLGTAIGLDVALSTPENDEGKTNA